MILGGCVEEILGTEKDLIAENTIRLLKNGDYSFSNRASQDIDLDRSWTKKSIIEEMVRYCQLKSPVYSEESTAVGCKGEPVYLIKPVINDVHRWIVYKFAENEYGETVLIFIISAHIDKNIYGEYGDIFQERGEGDEENSE